METKKQESPNWKKYQDSHDFISEGFPFNEGFPVGGPYGNSGRKYELILRDGQRAEAQVDYSTQYRAEGLRWLVGKRTTFGTTFDRCVVVAWREL